MQVVRQFLLEESLKRLLHNFDKLMVTSDGIFLAGRKLATTLHAFQVVRSKERVVEHFYFLILLLYFFQRSFLGERAYKDALIEMVFNVVVDHFNRFMQDFLFCQLRVVQSIRDMDHEEMCYSVDNHLCNR